VSLEERAPSEPSLAIRARNLGKCYQVYRRPQERLLQLLFRNRKRFYREFWALRGVDLDLRRGETVGIVGRNGAGKTTLLQLLAGTLQATEGELEVQGRVTSLLELGSGFNGEFTGRENVFLNGAVLGVSRAEMDARFDKIVQFADIGDFLDQPVKTYSSGMFVRLAFSVLANLDPDIFIVDEALAVGDAFFRHRCMYRFAELQEQGTAILFVSHDAVSVKQLCDRVLWLEGGVLREEGDPEPVVDSYLKSLFGLVEETGQVSGDERPSDSGAATEPGESRAHGVRAPLR
jgi:lipopolysaccharide transport system ATP-binding protein